MAKAKKILKIIANIVLSFVSVIGGFFVLLMNAFSLYGLEIAAMFVMALILMFLLVNAQKKACFFKFAFSVLIAGLILTGSVIGFKEYRRSIPVVTDRGSMLREYDPFEEDTQAVLLSEKSTLFLDYPQASGIRLNGATALYPVYASFVRNVFEPTNGYYRYANNASNNLQCSGTKYAFEELIAGEADIIFCAAPSEKQLKAAEDAGMQFHMHKIGMEAFVFFVNSENPVEELTVDEIRAIYSGKITNWKELGGKNRRILPYQREEGSGSQTAMLSFMNSEELIEPKTEEVIADMGGIIQRVADYRNHKGAIGYTFRFYSNEMVGNKQIRLLKLNGIEAKEETIRSGKYPIADYFYAITASKIGEPAPEENDPILRAFLEWMKGEQGQKIVDEVGYVSIY